ncbi:MAG TPA: PAC2 family protein [Actinomycetota bacterium]|nr:PAC2 family protein [Actinomycetota bacterium]
MSAVQWIFRPEVSRPTVVCAFAGWNDGGEAATTAAQHLRDRWVSRRFATLDPEEFYDFQVNRPTARLQAGLTRRLDWPTNEFFVAAPGGRDAVLLIGVEPNVRWRTYCETVLQVASEVEASLLVTLGAFLADVPHTVAAPVAASSSDPEWLQRPGVEAARYEGPTGIVGVLHDAASQVGMPSLSLWGAAPHYLPSTANPKVALALLEAVRDVVGLQVDTGDLERVAAGWQRRIDEEIAEDAELADYVRRLEEASGGPQDLGPVPSGDDLAAELERYLRDRRPDE